MAGSSAAYLQSRLAGASAPKVSPPVSKARQDFVYTDEDEMRLERAARKAKQRAMAAAAKKKKSKKSAPLSQAGGDPTTAILAALTPQAPPPPVLPPIIDPTKQLMGGLQRNAGQARKATGRQKRQTDKALGNIQGDPVVAGATTQDVYSGVMGGIEGAQRGIGTEISSEVAEFVLKQMQANLATQQQYQTQLAGFQNQQMASPAQIAQLASTGLLGKVDLNNPVAVAMALQATRQGSGEISNSLKAQLHGAGIDWHDYQFDDLGARIALQDKRKGLGVSDSELRSLLKEALG